MRIVLWILIVLALAVPAGAQVVELQGSWVIDGYRFDPGDRSPRGTIAYDRDANLFRGTYVGLKLPADRPELHAWLYDTRSKQAQHLGRVPYKAATVGKNKPAFYLYAPLPGAHVPQIYCGHGQDFSFTSNQDHTCFD